MFIRTYSLLVSLFASSTQQLLAADIVPPSSSHPSTASTVTHSRCPSVLNQHRISYLETQIIKHRRIYYAVQTPLLNDGEFYLINNKSTLKKKTIASMKKKQLKVS